MSAVYLFLCSYLFAFRFSLRISTVDVDFSLRIPHASLALELFSHAVHVSARSRSRALSGSLRLARARLFDIDEIVNRVRQAVRIEIESFHLIVMHGS